MFITVIGTGYVGLSTGVTLASLNHTVVCVDVDESKVHLLSTGTPPFFEPDLQETLMTSAVSENLTFTSDLDAALAHSDLVYLCVGTPSREDGSTDLRQLMDAVNDIKGIVALGSLVVIKSTVPVGTARMVQTLLPNAKVVSNPEFLREGSALQDSLHPHRIIVGVEDEAAEQRMHRIYQELCVPIISMTFEEAELVKYASNAFLATKLAFINTISDFGAHWGADIHRIAEGLGLDPRIGPHFLQAGLGFGGSCLPKDLRSLMHQFRTAGVSWRFFAEISEVNRARVRKAVERLEDSMGSLAGKTVSVLGLAFKAQTDDVRESQSLALIRVLTHQGASIKAYDPAAMANAALECPGAIYCDSAEMAAEGADAMVIATEWPEFKGLPWEKMIGSMRGRLVLDARNLLDEAVFHGMNVTYTRLGAAPRQA